MQDSTLVIPAASNPTPEPASIIDASVIAAHKLISGDAPETSNLKYEEEDRVARVKHINSKYIKEHFNDYEKLVITAVNDWHTPQLRNTMAYQDKVNPNRCINEFGTTFLHYVCSKQDSLSATSVGPVVLLLQAGASIFSQDDDGLTPYEYAHLKNNSTNKEILEKEFLFLKNRNEAMLTKLEKISKGDYVVETGENANEIAEHRQKHKLFIELKIAMQSGAKKELTPDEQEILDKPSNSYSIVPKEEFEAMLLKTQEFAQNQDILEAKIKACKESSAPLKLRPKVAL